MSEWGPEEWRSIIIDNIKDYEISNYGRVKSWKPYRNYAPTGISTLLKLQKDQDGYYRTTLRNNFGKRCYFFVAYLVALMWHGPRPNGMVVRHLDGCRTNNYYKNLMWGTPLENSNDSKLHGTWIHGTKVNTSKLNEEKVREIKKSNDSLTNLAKEYGVTIGAIWHIKDGRTWKHVN